MEKFKMAITGVMIEKDATSAGATLFDNDDNGARPVGVMIFANPSPNTETVTITDGANTLLKLTIPPNNTITIGPGSPSEPVFMIPSDKTLTAFSNTNNVPITMLVYSEYMIVS